MKKIVLVISIIHFSGSVFSQTKKLTGNFLNNVGDSVLVTGQIYGGAYLIHVKTKPTFLNLGDTSPNHRLIIRIEPEDRDKFPTAPEKYYLNKIVRVTGKLQEYKGSPMIQVSNPAMLSTSVADTTINVADNYTSVGAIAKSTNSPSSIPSARLVVPDSVLQTNWIKSVAEKAAEEKKRNVLVVQKTIDLRTAPYKNAPLIAQLQPGVQVSILYTSKKWSYVSIGSIDGFNNVNGFIRHRRFSKLKKVTGK